MIMTALASMRRNSRILGKKLSGGFRLVGDRKSFPVKVDDIVSKSSWLVSGVTDEINLY